MKKGISLIDLFTVLLAVAFITLKVANVISWSWIWVLSPIWISILLGLLLLPLKIKAMKAAEDNKQLNKFFEERLKNLKK